MKANFDVAALNYDNTFTNSVIGRLQRKLVYHHLSQLLKNSCVHNILEVNCGTGEDAIWFAKQNYNITATDISEQMIAVANTKIEIENLKFKLLDINNLNTYNDKGQFDLIFSNFGGLNCLNISELTLFFKNAHDNLSENGKIALVIMPRDTLWEQFYFFIKLDFTRIFRRKRNNIVANVDGEKVRTFYYNPKEILNIASCYFKIKQIKPIGFFIPPSYLEIFFKNKPRFISILNRFENSIKNLSWLSKFADHYYIVLEKI